VTWATVGALAVVGLAVLWVACYAVPATRSAALALLSPLVWLLAAMAVGLSLLVLLAPRRPRQGRPVDAPPGGLTPGAALGVDAMGAHLRSAADGKQAAQSEKAAELVASEDMDGLLTAEREARARLGLPPL